MILIRALVRQNLIRIGDFAEGIVNYKILIPNRSCWLSFIKWAISWEMKWFMGDRISMQDYSKFRKGYRIIVCSDYSTVDLLTSEDKYLIPTTWNQIYNKLIYL